MEKEKNTKQSLDQARSIIARANIVTEQVGGVRNLMECLFPSKGNVVKDVARRYDVAQQKGYNLNTGMPMCFSKIEMLASLGLQRGSAEIVTKANALVETYEKICVESIADEIENGNILPEISSVSTQKFLEEWKSYDGNVVHNINSCMQSEYENVMASLSSHIIQPEAQQ